MNTDLQLIPEKEITIRLSRAKQYGKREGVGL